MCKDYVECPICGKKLMNMTSHIKAHGIEIKDFKIKYPNVDLVSESYRSKMSSKMKVVRNRDDVKAKTSENSKRMWGSSEFKDKMHKIHLEVQSDKDLQSRKSKTLKNTWKRQEVRNRIIDAQKKAQSLESEKERKSRQGKLNWESKEYRSKVRKHRSVRILDNGEPMIFASSWEVKVSKYLDSLDIEWDYETLQFEYFTNDGKSHNYYPDFYLRDLDLILEVKPKHEIELEVNQLKFSSVVSCGRNIMYITQDDIVNIDTFKDKIYGVHRLSKTEM